MSCNIGKVELCYRHGDTADAWAMQFLDKDNNMISIAGYEFFMEIRSDGKKVELKTLGNGLSVQDDLSLIIDKETKEDLEPGVYTYAIKMKEPDGDLYTFIEGSLTINPELVDEDA